MSCQQQEEQQTAKMKLVREEEHGKQAKRNETKRHERKAEKEADEKNTMWHKWNCDELYRCV